MKKTIFLFNLIGVFLLFSCSEEQLREPETRFPNDGDPALNEWIKENFTDPYNIQVVYAWKTAGSDLGVDLVPPKLGVIQPFLKIVMKVWGQPYVKTSPEGAIFLKKSTLREFRLFGKDHSFAAATADNGYRITMYGVDGFTPSTLGKYSKAMLIYFFHTVHHEYGHILNQMYNYDPEFIKISGPDYKADFNAYPRYQALSWGFVSNYAMSAPGEDFVEVLSIYVTSTIAEWNALLEEARAADERVRIETGEVRQGRDRIMRKQAAVDKYMRQIYEIDIDTLRYHVINAINEVVDGNIEIN